MQWEEYLFDDGNSMRFTGYWMDQLPVLRFLNPAMFGTADEFSRLYATPIQQQNDKEVAAELRRKMYPCILRRLKKRNPDGRL